MSRTGGAAWGGDPEGLPTRNDLERLVGMLNAKIVRQNAEARRWNQVVWSLVLALTGSVLMVVWLVVRNGCGCAV